MRRSIICYGGLLQGIGFGGKKNEFFTSLWRKPETRDERVKEYVPEVIEESFSEQRAVLQESSSRDVIVDLGHKVLKEVENKSPTPNIAPHLNKLLQEYGAENLIAHRPLSYLLYPSSAALSGHHQPHELIVDFSDNFRAMVEEVERSDCSIRRGKGQQINDTNPSNTSSGYVAPADIPDIQNVDGKVSGPIVMSAKENHEPMDITLFVRVVAAMAMANIHCGDIRNAIRCTDVAIAHVVDTKRLGGLLGMKAGLLVRQKQYEQAAEMAKLAVDASGNIQGYLHGAYALCMLQRQEEMVKLLERGREDHPMNQEIVSLLETAQKDIKLALSA